MKNILIAAAIALALSSITPAAFAANSQNQKMTDCNHKATGMKGDAREQFMKACLSGDQKKMTQQQKMTKCNAEAKVQAPTGQEHKDFMKKCLSD